MTYHYETTAIEGAKDAYKIAWYDEAGTEIVSQETTIIGPAEDVAAALAVAATRLKDSNSAKFAEEESVNDEGFVMEESTESEEMF